MAVRGMFHQRWFCLSATWTVKNVFPQGRRKLNEKPLNKRGTFPPASSYNTSRGGRPVLSIDSEHQRAAPLTYF